MAIKYRAPDGEIISSKDIHDYSKRYDALAGKDIPEHLRDSYLEMVDEFGEKAAAAAFDFTRELARLIINDMVSEIVLKTRKGNLQEEAEAAWQVMLHKLGVT